MQHNYDNDDPAKRFEFREEYWEQALALIEADEARRRKKRQWLLWWSFAGAILIGAGLGWWCLASGDETAAVQGAGLLGKDLPSTQSQTNNSSGSDTLEHAYTATATDGGTLSQTEGDTGGVFTQNNDKQAFTTNPKAGITVPQQSSKLIIEDNSSIQANNRPSTAGRQSSAENLSSGTPDTPKEQQPSSIETNRDSALSFTGDSQKEGVSPNPEQKAPEESPERITVSPEQLLGLPLPFDSVFSKIKSSLKTPAAVQGPLPKQIKPLNDKRFSFGVSASGAAYSPSPDLRWLGCSGGIWGAYRLTENWSTSVGVDMRFQPGSWQDSATVDPIQSLLYSFGFESFVSESRAVGLLSVEVPIAAAWQRGVFSVNAGVAPGRLLYALDRFKQTKESSFQSLKTVKNRLERGDTTPFNRGYVNTFIGAEWRFSRNVSLTLRGNYRVGQLVKGSFESSPIKNGSNVALGIRLKLF